MLRMMRLLTAALVLSQACAIAQISTHDRNLDACKEGQLTAVQRIELVRATKRRNMSNCQNGSDLCDYSKFTLAEAK